MPLQAGTRLGGYEILAQIGVGGMGEVYQARDTRLKRDVALKVLPDTFAQDTDRLARFQREAELLATLNHPNIAGIYGLEESNGVRALVLELVEGPTLADRIAKGAIPLDDALPIARQIAEALEAAHEQGIIHRDLKPADIKVRPDGTVKVLDFGLAKLADPTAAALQAGPNVNVTASPLAAFRRTRRFHPTAVGSRTPPQTQQGRKAVSSCTSFRRAPGFSSAPERLRRIRSGRLTARSSSGPRRRVRSSRSSTCAPNPPSRSATRPRCRDRESSARLRDSHVTTTSPRTASISSSRSVRMIRRLRPE
jgi:serine/threonine protein kinase